MNVENTIRDSIAMYPLLFSTGGDVLHHVLCVLGSGFHWKDGEAVTLDPISGLGYWSAENELAEFYRRYPSEPLQSMMKQYTLEDIAMKQKRVDEIDVNWNSYEITDEHFYPQSTMCLLMTVPDDVTDDWHEAVEKMKVIATAHGWKF